MTAARRRTRRSRRQPALLAAGLLVALWLTLAIAHVLGWLLLTAAIAAGAYLAGRKHGEAPRSSAGPAPVQRVTRDATSADTAPRTAGPAAAEARLASVTAERDQLAARAADLSRQLADAGTHRRQLAEERARLARRVTDQARQITDLTEIAHAAWDAAASVTPRPPAEPRDADGRRGALLADPLSGARPLVGR